MKALFIAITSLLVLVSWAAGQAYAYGLDGGYMIQSQQPDRNNVSGIGIQDIRVIPSEIQTGDSFAVNATLVDNSPGTIYVEHGACEAPFSVTFDSHVLVRVNNITCTTQMVLQKLSPGTSITASSPYLDVVYRADASGNANATATFRYSVWDQTAQSSVEHTVSKPFQFVISGSNAAITLDVTGQPATNKIAPPFVQIRSGISAQDVRCEQGFQIVIKAEDNSPYCVRPDTAAILVERGWAATTIAQNCSGDTLVPYSYALPCMRPVPACPDNMTFSNGVCTTTPPFVPPIPAIQCGKGEGVCVNQSDMP